MCKTPSTLGSLIVEQKPATAVPPTETLLITHPPISNTHMHSLLITFRRRIAVIERTAQLVERGDGKELGGFAVGIRDAGHAAVVAGVVGQADDGLEGGGVVALAGEVEAWGWGEDVLRGAGGVKG